MPPIVGDTAPRERQQPAPMRSHSSSQQNHMRRQDVRRDAAIDPALASEGTRADRMQDQGYKDAVKAWSRFRFVRAGWFTPAEAIDYIE